MSCRYEIRYDSCATVTLVVRNEQSKQINIMEKRQQRILFDLIRKNIFLKSGDYLKDKYKIQCTQ